MARQGGFFYLWVVLFGLRRGGVAHASLSVVVPDRVAALLGTCAVIPCSFSPPPSSSSLRLKLRYESGVFLPRGTAFSSDEPRLAHRDFRGRTALAGDLARGDCSVRMEAVTADDRRKYEVWLKEAGETGWRRSGKVFLDVSDTPQQPLIVGPGAIVEGQLVTLNCSVSSPCPSLPPRVQWRWERGGREAEGGALAPAPAAGGGAPLSRENGQILSSLSFVASSSLPQPRVRCEARYPRGKTVSVAREMHVRFPPRDVAVHVLSLAVQEGASVLLSCSCKSDPPALEFGWWRVRAAPGEGEGEGEGGRRVVLAERTPSVRLLNVSRGLVAGCWARNAVGRAESGPTAVDVQYKPTISPLSLCLWDGGGVSCSCVVDANPRPAVTWSVNGSVVPDDGSGGSYSSSVSAGNGTLTATLRGGGERPVSVACHAFNALGNDSSALPYANSVGRQPEDSLMWKVVPAASVLSTLTLLFLLALVLLCHRCRRKTEKPPSSVFPGNLGIYQEIMPLYINCSEVTHVYTNGSYQLIYQNCTPLFVRNKQVLQASQRQRQRRRQRRVAWTERQAQRDRRCPETNAETPVYLEII